MDVTNSTVQLNTPDGKMDSYVAQPKDGGTYPGIVVIQEAFGVNSHIKKVTSGSPPKVTWRSRRISFTVNRSA